MTFNLTKKEIIILLLVFSGLVFAIILFSQLLKLIKEIIKNKNKDLFGYKGKIIYYDSGEEAKLLKYEDDKIILLGKPDYVLEIGKGKYIIVDAKSGKLDKRNPNSVKLQSYAQQIINYFLLVENDLKIKPLYGELYFLEDNQRFRIENTDEIKRLGLRNLHLIAEGKKLGIKPDERSYIKCELCPYNDICPRRIKKKGEEIKNETTRR
ncbi:MAG TPA: PD-(D/E)XK nuclease family protein [bacterium]|nr:PD-(D/E)XK nuclease family protein [bacterium]HOL47639.1 PD-(D/E)XK nuclease family protein [bacterium]HPQ19649.1 PD-(D/E)XK nuclease family protein [bacterium]